MKTAISISDGIFESAEKLAARLKISRSELYSRALKEYLKKQDTDNITERLNAVYGSGEESLKMDSNVDPLLYRAQLETLDNEE